MTTLSAPSRRSRFAPEPTGKRLTLKPRDRRWLEALRDHGPLPAHYLHAFTADSHGNEKASGLRLTDLVSETNTPHGGAYLFRPAAQCGGLTPLNRPMVYDLTPAGWMALGEAPADAPRPGGPFRHRFMVACVTASIELSCLRSPNLGFIAGRTLLADPERQLAVDLPNDVRNGRRQRLVPDQLFALEYRRGREKRYLSCVVECDRGTEPITSASDARKSYDRNYEQYRQFVGRGHYRDVYGLRSNMVVLNVMNSTRRQAAYMDLISRRAPRGNSFMLFQTVEGFGATFAVPSILDALMQQSWQRVGHPSFSLADPS